MLARGWRGSIYLCRGESRAVVEVATKLFRRLLTPLMPYATLPSAGGSPVYGGALFLMEGQRGVRGPLAQLAEQVTLNHPVPGSIPGRLTTRIHREKL